MKRKPMATFTNERKNEYKAILEFLVFAVICVSLSSIESIVDGVLSLFGV